MSLSKRTYMEAKLHLQQKSQGPGRDAQQRELRGQPVLKRPKYQVEEVNAQRGDSPNQIEDSDGDDGWNDGVEVKPVGRLDYSAAFGFLDDDVEPERTTASLTDQTSDNQPDDLMIVDEGNTVTPSEEGMVTKKEEQDKNVTKKEADGHFLKIERQQDEFQKLQVAEFFQQIDLSVGTKTKDELEAIKLEVRSTKRSSFMLDTVESAMLPRVDLDKTFLQLDLN